MRNRLVFALCFSFVFIFLFTALSDTAYAFEPRCTNLSLTGTSPTARTSGRCNSGLGTGTEVYICWGETGGCNFANSSDGGAVNFSKTYTYPLNGNYYIYLAVYNDDGQYKEFEIGFFLVDTYGSGGSCGTLSGDSSCGTSTWFNRFNVQLQVSGVGGGYPALCYDLACPNDGPYGCTHLGLCGTQSFADCKNGGCAGGGDWVFDARGVNPGYNCPMVTVTRIGPPPPTEKQFDVTLNCTPTTPPPTVNLNWGGSDGVVTIPSGSSGTLNWVVQESTTSCTGSSTAGDFSGSKTFPVGSEAKGPIASSRTYTLTCSGPGGSGQDSVIVNVQPNQPPTTSNVRSAEPDYCTVGPSITASWTYSDPEGSSQSAYRIQIDDNSGFSSPEYDSGKTSGAITSRYLNAGMTWGTVYRMRVMTWDGSDTASAWTQQSLCTGPVDANSGEANPSGCQGGNASWKTPNNQYPSNISTFTWTPNKPQEGQSIQFDDASTVCYKTPPNTPDACASWNWNFGDSTTSTLRDPTKIYTSSGNYSVRLRAQDSLNGYHCSFDKTVSVQKPIPDWREVFPQ